ncbi:MAG: ATP-dependent DNA helicase [Thermoplasmata archaeon]
MPRNLFPYDAPRAGQAEFLRDARECLGEGGILLAQAPTGLGKTAVAIAASLEVARAQGKKVFFTTARRSQHRIAIETVRLIRRAGTSIPTVDLIAREAMCPDHKESHAGDGVIRPFARTLLHDPLHAQEAIRLAARFRVCPYGATLHAAKRADLLVCDYNHLFDPVSRGVLRSVGVRLSDLVCVVDEAHNLPSRARSSLSSRITAPGLARLVGRPSSRRRKACLVAVSRLLAAEARFVGGDSRVPTEFLDRLLDQIPQLSRRGWPRARLTRHLERLAPSLGREETFVAEDAISLLRAWEEPDHLRLLSPREGGSLHLSALDPEPATGDVFRRVHAALLMSGTLHPGEMYVDLLGIDPVRARTGVYLPAFPAENRLLLATPGLSLAYRKRPAAYTPCAREIARLCEEIPGNVAAFFPSYEVARQVGEALKAFPHRKRTLWERRGQPKAVKEGLLQMLQAGQGGYGSLLMAVQGGSLSEGMDYPGNLLSGVIVAGLALSPPDLRIEALRSFYARRFGRQRGYAYAYLYPAINRAVQCAGRCIRGEADVAAVVILDDRVLRPFVRSRLPHGFRPRPSDDVAAEVRTFFYGGQHEPHRAHSPRGRGPHHQDGVAGATGRGEATGSEGLPARRP